jgi:hypothetical protein
LALAAIYLGPGGEEAVIDKLLEPAAPKVRQSVRQEFERLDPKLVKALRNSERAGRVLILAKLAPRRNEQANEILVEPGILRLAASAILEIQPGQGVDLTELAMRLPSFFHETPTLATLFDHAASFGLRDGKIALKIAMRYEYAESMIKVEPRGLIYVLDESDSAKPVKAKKLSGLAEAANTHFEDIANAYQPLQRMLEYASLAAFLRWAACPTNGAGTCIPRPGLTIDLSSLGGYDLRDRTLTPTPDWDPR